MSEYIEMSSGELRDLKGVPHGFPKVLGTSGFQGGISQWFLESLKGFSVFHENFRRFTGGFREFQEI